MPVRRSGDDHPSPSPSPSPKASPDPSPSSGSNPSPSPGPKAYAGGDRLRELLDLVVRSVEDPACSGEALAGRAYLSRFHFDRLVSAAIREPVGAFRRRLLLERAAFRLRGGDPVTDVAFDAGYGSLEGFERAFRRAYGRVPSALRKDPGARVLLPAPNGIHFSPPGALRLPAYEGSTAMDVASTMLEHDQWLVGQLIERAGRLDPADLERPITMSVDALDEGSSLRDLLHTLVSTKERWIAAVEGSRPPGGDPLGSELPESERTIPALQRRFADAGPRFVRLANGIRERGEESVTFIDATCDPPRTFSYGGMIAHVLNFSAYRRTLAVAALAEYGIDDLGFGGPEAFASEQPPA